MITTINPTGPSIVISRYQEQHGENVSIGLSSTAETAISWAMMKMAEEERVKELARRHLTVADAVEAVKVAEEQLQMVAALVK